MLLLVSHLEAQGGDELVPWVVYCSQLKTVAPAHLSIKRLEGAEEAFERAAATFVAA